MEPGAVTGWIPIGDVSPVSGGLLYLEGSRDMGLEIERAFLEMNKELDAESQLSAFNQNVSSPHGDERGSSGRRPGSGLTADALRRWPYEGLPRVRRRDQPPLAGRRLPRGRRCLPPLVHDPL